MKVSSNEGMTRKHFISFCKNANLTIQPTIVLHLQLAPAHDAMTGTDAVKIDIWNRESTKQKSVLSLHNVFHKPPTTTPL